MLNNEQAQLGKLDFVPPSLKTARLILESIDESHATELWNLFSDTELHTFVPMEPPTLEQQVEKCARWAKRRSTDGTELWLGRNIQTKMPVGHFQAGLKGDGIASIGYVVARRYQNLGMATEALKIIFNYLQKTLAVCEIKAWSDTRNLASHHLAKKMGMTQIEVIKNVDFFKGAASDEYVFSRKFEDESK